MAAKKQAAKSTAKKDKRRAAWSRFFFTDRVEPVTPTELEAAHHDGHGHETIDDGDERGRHVTPLGGRRNRTA